MPWDLLTLGDEAKKPGKKCRELINTLLRHAETHSQLAVAMSQQQQLVDADTDMSLMNIAGERLTISPDQAGVFPLVSAGDTADLEDALTKCDDEFEELPPEAPDDEPSAEQQHRIRTICIHLYVLEVRSIYIFI